MGGKYSPRVEKLDFDGQEITLYGRYHLEEPFQENKDRIAGFMESSDVFAWEGVSYTDNTEEGAEFFPEDIDIDYGEEMLEMSLRNFDIMVGPESKMHFPYGLSPYRVLLINVLFLHLYIIYRLVRLFTSWIKYLSNDLDQEDVSEKDLDPPSGFKEKDFELTRRKFLTGIGIGGPFVLSGGFEEILRESGVLGMVEDDAYKLSLNYNDMREVYIAEALAREASGDVFGVFGKNHVVSVANYLEHGYYRRLKLGIWKFVVPEDDKKVVVYRNTGDSWIVDSIYKI